MQQGSATQDNGQQDGGAAAPEQPYVLQLLQDSAGPIVAATDYVRQVPEAIRAYLPTGRSYRTLGTDGFGRSDTRAELRRYFQVDAQAIVQAALRGLSLHKG